MIVDAISVAISAALFGSGWVLGRVARLHSQPKTVRPICECDHHYGTHADDGCRASVEVQRWSGNYRNGFDYEPCACLRYTGPVPLDQFWAPPIANSE